MGKGMEGREEIADESKVAERDEMGGEGRRQHEIHEGKVYVRVGEERGERGADRKERGGRGRRRVEQ